MIKYNLIGKKFGKLLVIENLLSKNESRMWLCKCECGKEKITRTKSLMNGDTITCGCGAKTRAKKHGLANSKPYHVWFAMKRRIMNTKSKDYKLYGGRGITLDKKWIEFNEFWKDMGNSYKQGLSLDRIDNNKGYFKENCRWVDSFTQANNTRKNILITFRGKTKTMSEWARKYNIHPFTLRNRLVRSKWSITKSLTYPVKR